MQQPKTSASGESHYGEYLLLLESPMMETDAALFLGVSVVAVIHLQFGLK
jgi:hypothetical protein